MGLRWVLGLPMPGHRAGTLCSQRVPCCQPKENISWARFFMYSQQRDFPSIKVNMLWNKKAVVPSKPCHSVSTLQPESHPNWMNRYAHMWPWHRRSLPWGGNGWCCPCCITLLLNDEGLQHCNSTQQFAAPIPTDHSERHMCTVPQRI